jgi:hypothetical protein
METDGRLALSTLYRQMTSMFICSFGSAFGGDPVDACSAALVAAGYHYAGKECNDENRL